MMPISLTCTTSAPCIGILLEAVANLLLRVATAGLLAGKRRWTPDQVHLLKDRKPLCLHKSQLAAEQRNGCGVGLRDLSDVRRNPEVAAACRG